jgi:hypothetical protein
MTVVVTEMNIAILPTTKLGAILDGHPTTNNLCKHQQGHSSFVGQYIFQEQKTQQVLEDTL